MWGHGGSGHLNTVFGSELASDLDLDFLFTGGTHIQSKLAVFILRVNFFLLSLLFCGQQLQYETKSLHYHKLTKMDKLLLTSNRLGMFVNPCRPNS